jgi:hypothetical protein
VESSSIEACAYYEWRTVEHQRLLRRLNEITVDSARTSRVISKRKRDNHMTAVFR